MLLTKNRNVLVIFIYSLSCVFFFSHLQSKKKIKVQIVKEIKIDFRPIRSYKVNKYVVVGREVFRMIDHIFQH
jgi:hypothetical protein